MGVTPTHVQPSNVGSESEPGILEVLQLINREDHIATCHEGKKPFKCNTEYIFKVLALNACGITCSGRLEQIRDILIKYDVSIAVLSETETTHSIAATTSIDGFKAFCPPTSVTGPSGKEAGVIILVSNNLASDVKPRPDINGNDTVQSTWIEITSLNTIIAGVYRRSRTSLELETLEFAQLSDQVLKASSCDKSILVLGDVNIDHTNPNHKKTKKQRSF